jgi:hypothetical protein
MYGECCGGECLEGAVRAVEQSLLFLMHLLQMEQQTPCCARSGKGTGIAMQWCQRAYNQFVFETDLFYIELRCFESP